LSGSWCAGDHILNVPFAKCATQHVAALQGEAQFDKVVAISALFPRGLSRLVRFHSGFN